MGQQSEWVRWELGRLGCFKCTVLYRNKIQNYGKVSKKNHQNKFKNPPKMGVRRARSARRTPILGIFVFLVIFFYTILYIKRQFIWLAINLVLQNSNKKQERRQNWKGGQEELACAQGCPFVQKDGPENGPGAPKRALQTLNGRPDAISRSPQNLSVCPKFAP